MESERSRSFIASSYGVALLMFGVAGTDVISRILPLRVGDTAWRIGSVGIVALSVPTLVLALLIGGVTAWYLQHRVLLRVMAVACLAAAVVMVGVLPFFALDVLELRRLVQPEARPSFHFAMGRAALTVLLTALLLGWTGWAGWRASAAGSRSVPAREKAMSRSGSGMLVGRPG
jgi:hypothetical protein